MIHPHAILSRRSANSKGQTITADPYLNSIATLLNELKREVDALKRQLAFAGAVEVVPLQVTSIGDIAGVLNGKQLTQGMGPNTNTALAPTIDDLGAAKEFEDAVIWNLGPIGGAVFGRYLGQQKDTGKSVFAIISPGAQGCLVQQNGTDPNGDPTYDIFHLDDTDHANKLNDDPVVPEQFRDADVNYTAGDSGIFQVDLDGIFFLWDVNETPDTEICDS
jgi:hypothetical protein